MSSTGRSGGGLTLLLTADQIADRVRDLAAEISKDYAASGEPLLLVGVLKGCCIFLSDLMRAMTRDAEIDFVAIASYGARTQTSGEVRVLKDLDAAVGGKHVVIVEDILDTGLTLRFSYLMESLRARGAASVKLCVLLDKPARREAEITADYRGFEIDNVFVVGYGMDFNEQYRGLPYIAIFQEDQCTGQPIE